MVITIKVEGMGKVRKAMTGYTRNIPTAGRAGVWNFAQRLAKALRNAAPRGATGHMKSVKGTFAEKVNKNEYVIKMPIYTKYVEKGTKPQFPVSPTRHPRFAMWARIHGMNAWALGRYASIHGTKAHPFTARVIQNEVKKLKRTVERRLNKTIKKRGKL